MKEKIILQLCADTGSDTKPYADAGYKVILIGKDIGVENYHPPKNVFGIIANPVCLEFSRARNGGIARDPEKGMELVKECQRIIAEAKPVFWVIENPASGALRDFLGKPVMTYQPWHYGSPWTKHTALWGKFNIPKRKYFNWEDVPKIKGLYARPGRSGIPGMYQLHVRAHGKFIKEFARFLPELLQKPPRDKVNGGGADMEFRSLCSQNFAQAFFKANQ